MHQERSLRLMCLMAWLGILIPAVSTAQAQVDLSANEQELTALLQSDAPAAEKALACKFLAVKGSAASVPALARLLSHEQLASWSRIALEAIPAPEVDEAFRTALDSLEGNLLVGVINSIGVRRDAAAVDALAGRIEDPDLNVASAAAAALGRIGSPAAAQALLQALAAAPPPVRSAVAEGCVLCAERFLSEGRTADAVQIYDEVRLADVPRPRILEATRGAILARGADGIPLLIEQLRSADREMFAMALSTAREFPGRDLDEALASELNQAPAERAALIVHAMADRNETVRLPAVLNAAISGPREVRLAAIAALGRVGDSTCLAPLLEIGSEDDPELAAITQQALAELPGDDVDTDIVARLPDATGKTQRLLIELIGQRRINAMQPLLDAAGHSDPAIRHAALASLGATIPPDKVSVLIAKVIAPQRAEDVAAAQQALKAAAIRMPDREACAAEISAALETAPVATRSALLEILGAMGGPAALQTIGAAGKTNDAQLRDVSSRLLGEWMTIDAGPVLLELATSGSRDKYQVRALRGYLRIARQFDMPMEDRVTMCRNALAASPQPAEQKLVLEVLERNPSPATLELALGLLQVPELRADATRTILTIAQNLKKPSRQVRELLSSAGFDPVRLEIVKAEYGAGTSQKDVTGTLQQQARDLPMILLPASSFNASFGGDPAPGQPKQLRIQYRINDRAGEVSIPENGPIVLPMPE